MEHKDSRLSRNKTDNEDQLLKTIETEHFSLSVRARLDYLTTWMEWKVSYEIAGVRHKIHLWNICDRC